MRKQWIPGHSFVGMCGLGTRLPTQQKRGDFEDVENMREADVRIICLSSVGVRSLRASVGTEIGLTSSIGVSCEREFRW